MKNSGLSSANATSSGTRNVPREGPALPLTSADALIVIDVQNDFCPGGALAVADGDAVVPLVNRIAPEFRG